jgi:hypothetical protein
MDEKTRQKVQAAGEKLLRISTRYASRSRFLGSNLDDALASAMEFFCDNPESDSRPEAVFRLCLLREQSKRLKFGNGNEEM